MFHYLFLNIILLLTLFFLPITPASSCMEAPTPCCSASQKLSNLNNKFVVITGKYKVDKPAKNTKAYDPNVKSHTVYIIAENGIAIQLGLNYETSGQRSDEEIKKFDGKKINVLGILHSETPVKRASDGAIMQTTTGPYIDPVDSIILIK